MKVSRSIGASILALIFFGTSFTSANANTDEADKLLLEKQVALSEVEAEPDRETDTEIGLWQSGFNLMVMNAEERFPEDYADSAIDVQAASGWIGFRGTAPEGISKLIGGLEKVSIKENLGYTARQAEEKSRQANEVSSKYLAGRGNVVTYREGTDTTIHVVFDTFENRAGRSSYRLILMSTS